MQIKLYIHLTKKEMLKFLVGFFKWIIYDKKNLTSQQICHWADLESIINTKGCFWSSAVDLNASTCYFFLQKRSFGNFVSSFKGMKRTDSKGERHYPLSSAGKEDNTGLLIRFERPSYNHEWLLIKVSFTSAQVTIVYLCKWFVLCSVLQISDMYTHYKKYNEGIIKRNKLNEGKKYLVSLQTIKKLLFFNRFKFSLCDGPMY